MATPLLNPRLDLSEAMLADLAPSRLYCVWQFVERHYCLWREGPFAAAWMMATFAAADAERLRDHDAAYNARSPDLYRIDELALPDALAEARAIPTPFEFTPGERCTRVAGLRVVRWNGWSFTEIEEIPV